MHDALRRSIEDKAIGELVWLAGDRSDIPELLGMLDIFVLCSLAEGISNTILEAMASGLPIVATRTGGNPELVRDGYNGYLVPVSDPSALASRLKYMLEDIEQTRELGRRGRAIVDTTFTWDRTVDNYFAVYDEVLAACRGRGLSCGIYCPDESSISLWRNRGMNIIWSGCATDFLIRGNLQGFAIAHAHAAYVSHSHQLCK